MEYLPTPELELFVLEFLPTPNFELFHSGIFTNARVGIIRIRPNFELFHSGIFTNARVEIIRIRIFTNTKL